MTTLKDKIIEAGFADHVLTDVDLNNLLRGTPAACYGMVNKALKKAELIRLRRGLYLLADKYRHKKISNFFLANKIAPHSYISLESALAYHEWIPEHVMIITSILPSGRTKQFLSDLGDFFFYQMPVNEYGFLTGITRVETVEGQPFLIASPLRALADYVYIKKIDWNGLQYLTDSLRIDRENLDQIDSQDFIQLKKVYRSKRVLYFLEKLQTELNKR